MTEIALVGLDIAKSCFRVHAADSEGKPVLRRKLRRDRVAAFFAELAPVTVGIEACWTSHHWVRTIERPATVCGSSRRSTRGPTPKRSKTNSADAEAIAEAMRRSGIRDVAIKNPEQQAALAVHRARDLLVRQRTMLTNAVRGFAAEFGIVSVKGVWHVPAPRERLQDPGCSPRSAYRQRVARSSERCPRRLVRTEAAGKIGA